VDDLAKAYLGAASLKKGPSLGIGLWFDYDNVFQGFTITPGFGVGADFGGVVKATTAVENDASVGCDGARLPGLASLGPRTHIQQIRYDGGEIRHQKVIGKAPRPDLVRICLENYTGQPKQITHRVAGINPLTAPTNGSRSCANFSASVRLNFAFVDRGIVRKRDVMSLGHYAGDIVVFEWRRDY
jgi:hypothetical protein